MRILQPNQSVNVSVCIPSFLVGDIIVADSTSHLAALHSVALGQVLITQNRHCMSIKHNIRPLYALLSASL